MRISRRVLGVLFLGASLVVAASFVAALLLIASVHAGRERLAFVLVAIAVVVCTALVIAALPQLRRSLRYARRSRREIGEIRQRQDALGASLRTARIAAEETRRDVDTIKRQLVEVEDSLRHLPDTARTHKLLDTTLTRVERSVVGAISNEGTRTRNRLTRSTSNQTQQLYGMVDGLEALYRTLELDRALPPLGHFAIGADFGAYLVRHLLDEQPDVVVDLGSGVSTLLLALALQRVGGGHVVAVDHLDQYAEKTRRLLVEFGVSDFADVLVAPLVPTRIGQDEYLWYDLPGMAVPAAIDVLLVDGPPGSAGPLARFPAIPVLRDRLSPTAVVFVDDARRADEVKAVEMWCDHYSLRQTGPVRFATGTAELVPV